MKPKAASLKISKIDKPLTRLTRKKRTDSATHQDSRRPWLCSFCCATPCLLRGKAPANPNGHSILKSENKVCSACRGPERELAWCHQVLSSLAVFSTRLVHSHPPPPLHADVNEIAHGRGWFWVALRWWRWCNSEKRLRWAGVLKFWPTRLLMSFPVIKSNL